jgi:hypothetical protein
MTSIWDYRHWWENPELAAFRSIVDRIWKRLQDWKLKFLSQAGKEILIKAVIQAISSYCMSVFLLPKALCEEINKLMQKFWWSHFNKDSNVHWMSWKRMGVAKKMGGMGFRDLRAFNVALLAKQGWRLWKTPDSLIAQIMKGKYFPEGSILTASIGSNPSFAWRSIHGSCGLLNDGLIWRVRNGKKIRIWQERWLPNALMYKVMSPPTVLNPLATVSELIKEDTGWWDIDLLKRIFTTEEVNLIQAMPVSSTSQDDILVWRGTKTGMFTVRSAYYIQLELEKRYTAASSNNTGTSKIWTSLWALKIPNAEKNFVWKACHDILPTKANLCKRKIIDDPLCPLCEREIETVLHAIWQCPAAVDAWSTGCTKLQKKSFNSGNNFLQAVEEIFLQCDPEEIKQFVGIARRLWLRRNEVVHGGRMIHPNDLVSQTKTAMVEFAEATDRGAKNIVSAWEEI